MLLNTDYFVPSETTGYIREAALDYPINRFALAQWLPNRPIDDLVYRFTRGGDGLLDAATFRSFDAESSIGKRPAVSRVQGDLPPISRKIVLGEYDRLRQRAQPSPAIQQAILNDADKVARQVHARLELARGDALVNGRVTFTELGSMFADFGRDAACSVTAGTLWSNTGSANPIDDLTTWSTAYVAMNGVPPGAIVTSQRVRNYMLRNASIRSIAAVTGVTPQMVSQAKLLEVFDAFGLPPVMLYDAQVKVAGSTTRIIPDNVVLFLPESVAPDDFEGTQLGATFWGTTAESLDPRYGLETEVQAGIVAGVYDEEDPIQIWTKAAAIALPVLANPNLAWVATVA